MLANKWLFFGLFNCLLCVSSSLAEAKRPTPSDTIEEGWDNIFDRTHEFKPPAPHGRIKTRSFPKAKDKIAVKKDQGGKTSLQTPSKAPTRSPVVSQVNNDVEEETIDFATPIPSVYPTYAPNDTPILPSSAAPVQPDTAQQQHQSDQQQQSAPLLDFQISLSSQSSSSLDIDRLEESMETTLRLGMVLLDVSEIQFSTTPAKVDAWTFTFTDASAILKNEESSKLLQTQQIELLSDIPFVESALQQGMNDPTIRVQDIQFLQQSALLPLAALIGRNDAESDRNGVLMLIAAIVCFISFSLAITTCFRRYRTVKRKRTPKYSSVMDDSS